MRTTDWLERLTQMDVAGALRHWGIINAPKESGVDAVSWKSFEARTGSAIEHWLIFAGLSLFGFVLLWYFGFLQTMVVSDHTYISSVICVLYVLVSCHCFWRLLVLSSEAEAAVAAAQYLASHGAFALDFIAIPGRDNAGRALSGAVGQHIVALVTKARHQEVGRLDQTLLLRVLAGRIKGSNQFGSFAGDTLMKLGLLGTIVGFIMMLEPIAGLDVENQGAIKSSMTLMGGGMAVAMYTTLAGLVASILLRLQYYILESDTLRVFEFAVALTEVHVVSALEGRKAKFT